MSEPLTVPVATDHHILLAVQKQVAGLVAEREAQREQIAGLVAERNILKGENCRLRRILTQIQEIGYNHEVTDAAERMLKLAQER